MERWRRGGARTATGEEEREARGGGRGARAQYHRRRLVSKHRSHSEGVNMGKARRRKENVFWLTCQSQNPPDFSLSVSLPTSFSLLSSPPPTYFQSLSTFKVCLFLIAIFLPLFFPIQLFAVAATSTWTPFLIGSPFYLQSRWLLFPPPHPLL